MVEGAGVPLSAFITGANTHEVTKVESTLNSKVAHQQADGNEIDENLCADVGFVGAKERIEAFGYIPHIRPHNVEAELIKYSPDFKPRRWVVETFFSSLNASEKSTHAMKKLSSHTGDWYAWHVPSSHSIKPRLFRDNLLMSRDCIS